MCASTPSSCAPTAIATAIELARAKPLFDQNREQFHQFLTAQADIRGLPAIMMLDKRPQRRSSRPRRQSSARPSSSRRARCSPPINETEPQIALFLDANYVAAIIKLRAYTDTYLYVARLLDPRVVAQLRRHARPASANMPSSKPAGSASRSPSR